MTVERRASQDTAEPRRKISLGEAAVLDALTRLPQKDRDPHAELRVKEGVEKRLVPYIEEAKIVAEQQALSEFKKYKANFPTFLDARRATIQCSDGRIDLQCLDDPATTVPHRIPGGEFSVRPSTSSDHIVPGNPNIVASIFTDMEEREEDGRNKELIEKIGPHIQSKEPVKGCGALKRAIENSGHLGEVGMEYGGISEYFERMGEGFLAFENIARGAGGQAHTFDVTYDIWSRGLIFGLRQNHDFDRSRNLRSNLVDMHERGDILMTEFLDNMFTSDIDEVKHEIFQKLEAEAASPAFRRSLRGFAGAGIQVDLEDPRHFAATTILISEVAQRLTVQQEKDGLRFIPQHLLEGLTPMAARDLAYTAIRNVVARRLGKIVPGKHGLLEHNEELIVVGPTAPEFNKGTTAFRVGTASGELSEQNKSLTFTLHDILRDRFKEEGVSPREEALIVLVLEAFDPNEHGNNKKVERRVHNEVFSMVGDNASELRLARIKDVRGGYLVVVGAIIDPNTKVIREIVR